MNANSRNAALSGQQAEDGRLNKPGAHAAAGLGYPVPQHLAVILDGNRRWAQDRGLPTIQGYQAGGRVVPKLLTWCAAAGIQVVTLWPLSADNLRRTSTELQGLIAAITEVVAALASARQWRIRLIGQVDRLPAEAIGAIRRAETLTAGLAGITVNLALAYDGRAEITAAVQALWRERAAELTRASEITEGDIAARLSTQGQPDPDLIIRTSGEQRLSGFLPWQSVYSELYFCPRYWPDFRKADFNCALQWYGSRQRRFGR